MLKCFVDDSGSDIRKDGPFVLYGYIMEHPRWDDFAELWDMQLKRPDFYPIDYCRMADAESGDGPFAGIDSVMRQRKVRDLAEVIRSCNPIAVGCMMQWEHYNEIMKGKVPANLDNPYAVLFFQVLRAVTDIQVDLVNRTSESDKRRVYEEYGIEIAIKPVDFIFDDQGEAGLECLQWWGPLKARLSEPHSIVLSTAPQFKDDRKLLPLQAADMLAWHIRRSHKYPSEDRETILTLLNPAGVWEREITESMLHQVVRNLNGGAYLS